MDMSTSIEPRSDQLNADDLIAGPRTVTIDRVSEGAAEQPFDFHLVETPGRAYRPSKTMRRVIVAGWGSDTRVFAGRRLTLYREPTIRFGKDEVGGIRISHMSHITGPLKLQLTVSRGKRDPFVVQPLPDAPDVIPPITETQRTNLSALMFAKGWDDAQKLDWVTKQIGRKVKSARDLDTAEASALINALEQGEGTA